MKEVEPINLARRQIIARAMPVCALSCLGLGKAAASATPAPSFQPAKHPFDAKVEDITYRQFYASIFGDVIRMGKALEQELGKDKAIAFLKRVTTEMMTEYGQKQAQKSSDNSFRTWGDTFRDRRRQRPSPRAQGQGVHLRRNVLEGFCRRHRICLYLLWRLCLA
jgi:hypothetical protein